MLEPGPRRRGHHSSALGAYLIRRGAGIGRCLPLSFRQACGLPSPLYPTVAPMNEKLEVPLEAAARLLRQAKRIVCLTGAGVSSESGVATFRDTEDGLWSRFDPQMLASQAGFAADPGMVWQWYMDRLMAVESAQPNDGHRALARLEHRTPAFTVVTQNVDNLHERGDSQRVLHLHGRITRFRCNVCSFEHELMPAERRATRPRAA